MSDITFHPIATHQSLPEYQVGIATNTCEFPGIAQCIAIVGMMSNRMICAHVSPGTTQVQMNDIFDYLKQAGGDEVNYWYLLGPTEHHFIGRSTLWMSLKDIKKTFKAKLNNKSTSYLFLDASDERNTKVDFPEGQFRIASIDIRALKHGSLLQFSWKLREGRQKTRGDWIQFDLKKFKRF
ncbi:hypothetical protein [uncultured Paraglaciecola sp.]|uniref:hypothetical protein n=1 Tax=uncultured Paraglaciecola sp. TaxID=1765024 RepID=UPI0030DA5578|tara:strand:- start:10890 stop:11432 length:543 start_codon:yes stop_codon:yes gene_type:complete